MDKQQLAKKMADGQTDQVFEHMWDSLVVPIVAAWLGDDAEIPQWLQEFKIRFLFSKTQILRNAYAEQYARHFTTDELAHLVEWNESELGKKVKTVSQQLVEENVELGRRIGEELFVEIEKEAKQQAFMAEKVS